MIYYEYPFSEHTRTLLRLENLYDRFTFFVEQDDARDHHIALLAFFEIIEITARSDLRTDLIKELEKQRKSLENLLGNPQIETKKLELVLDEVKRLLAGIEQQSAKTSQSLLNNEWLLSIRSRVVIPGGTCNFDLPSYYAWQHKPAEQRRVDIKRWAMPFMPLSNAATFVLRLTRQSGIATKVLARQGCYQQMLAGRNFRLIKVEVDRNLQLIPEISASKHVIWVRFMKQSDIERPTAYDGDVPFALSLCSF